MPTVLLTKGYRFFFYVNDHSPPHIHVEKERSTAKFSLESGELIRSRRFNAKEIGEIRNIVAEHLELFKMKWNEFFNS
jgi:Domain of unknown function (DUF4160)